MVRKDFKSKARRAPPRRAKQKSSWRPFLAGLALGVFATTVAAVLDVPQRLMAELRGDAADTAAPVRAAPAARPRSAAPPAPVARASRPRSAPSPAQGGTGKPRFEFYTMLPDMEVAVPEEELRAVRTRKSTDTTQPAGDASSGEGKSAYVLQVGSFRRAEEAERLKANLAFLGMEAIVQSVAINGQDTWHRVRVGPYPNLEVLSEARTRLRENKIEPMVLKVPR